MEHLPVIGAVIAVFLIGWALIRLGRKLERGERQKLDLASAEKFSDSLQKWAKTNDIKKNEIDSLKKEAREKFNRGELTAGELSSLLSRAGAKNKPTNSSNNP